MPHVTHYLPEHKVILVRFSGDIAPSEEMRAFVETVTDPRHFPDAAFLIDKRSGRMTVGPADVTPQLDTVKEHMERMGAARVAHVVDNDYDYGMLRVMKAWAEEELPHPFEIFRSLEEACAWLGIEPGLVEEAYRAA